jgi:hypothetical protein
MDGQMRAAQADEEAFLAQLEEEPELRQQLLLFRNAGSNAQSSASGDGGLSGYQTEDEDEEDVAALLVPDSELHDEVQFAADGS